jgi:hypothetical protein
MHSSEKKVGATSEVNLIIFRPSDPAMIHIS